MSHNFDVNGVVIGWQQPDGIFNISASQCHTIDSKYTITDPQCTRPANSCTHHSQEWRKVVKCEEARGREARRAEAGEGFLGMGR